MGAEISPAILAVPDRGPPKGVRFLHVVEPLSPDDTTLNADNGHVTTVTGIPAEVAAGTEEQANYTPWSNPHGDKIKAVIALTRKRRGSASG